MPQCVYARYRPKPAPNESVQHGAMKALASDQAWQLGQVLGSSRPSRWLEAFSGQRLAAKFISRQQTSINQSHKCPFLCICEKIKLKFEVHHRDGSAIWIVLLHHRSLHLGLAHEANACMEPFQSSRTVKMIDDFKQDLANLSSVQILRKYILGAESQVLTADQHYQLREQVCEYFHVAYSEIIMVGSGKLGFSIKPARRFKSFNDKSDIDIAVVSPRLFEEVWREVYLFKKGGAYWPDAGDFFKYLSEGWIRPDKLPRNDYFKFTSQWWDFFNDLTRSGRYGPYKIRAGLYHSSFFFEEYQKICIEQCKELV